MRFSTFGKLFTKGLFKSFIDFIYPTTYSLSPLFYNICLRLCSLTLSFERAF